ncbi:hypothetical protein M407DRAFT_16739 [Tulasnella calospora MUT 4182]|uniref:Hydroxymethylglutaryl-coenzyme A synthase N-terminal domain-containing protein n=1 Tax=Tulasnella calospora MUT 4182 TaxID=1051891 RepID=A0A0C3LKZ7_9AGAM|nr:hypothetical protein M407DRAFT_16739 [Tulasnella calospora MUT 4182]
MNGNHPCFPISLRPRHSQPNTDVDWTHHPTTSMSSELVINSKKASHGPIAALFNDINWLESSSWDGRKATFFAGSITVYAAGGAGVCAVLIARTHPSSSILLQLTYMSNISIYKPPLDSEHPHISSPLAPFQPVTHGEFAIVNQLLVRLIAAGNVAAGQSSDMHHHDGGGAGGAGYGLGSTGSLTGASKLRLPGKQRIFGATASTCIDANTFAALGIGNVPGLHWIERRHQRCWSRWIGSSGLALLFAAQRHPPSLSLAGAKAGQQTAVNFASAGAGEKKGSTGLANLYLFGFLSFGCSSSSRSNDMDSATLARGASSTTADWSPHIQYTTTATSQIIASLTAVNVNPNVNGTAIP